MQKCSCRGCKKGFNQKKKYNTSVVGIVCILIGLLALGLLGKYEKRIESIPMYSLAIQ